jgi:hypothetical protein
LLLVAFGGLTNALIPLYAVGVFTSFTLSQFGMVRHHLAKREPGWQRSTVLNAAGALATFAVLLIVAITKFTSGAWVPILVIPLIYLLFKGIRRHYTHVESALRVDPGWRPPRRRHTVVVLAHGADAGVLEALAYARSIDPDRLLAVTVVADDPEAEQIDKEWAAQQIDVPLELVQRRRAISPTRSSTSSTSSNAGGQTTSSPSCCRSCSSSTGGATCSTTRAR